MICGDGHIIILHCELFCSSLLFKISLSQTQVIQKLSQAHQSEIETMSCQASIICDSLRSLTSFLSSKLQ